TSSKRDWSSDVCSSDLGAGLAAAAALTGSKVAALICLYGYYGLVGLDEAAGTSQPATDVPPTFIIHGRLDTLVPAPQARAFADQIGRASCRTRMRMRRK